jgi:hypothetical protein
MPDPDCPSEYVQQAEIIDLTWAITPRGGMSEGFELQKCSDESNQSSLMRHRDVPHTAFEDTALETGRGAGGHARTPATNNRRLSDSFDS